MRSLIRLTKVTVPILLLVLAAPQAVVADTPELIAKIVSDTTRTLFGYQILPLGDQDDDGFADMWVWDYRPAAYLFRGGTNVDSQYFLRIDSANRKAGNLGDINGDGFDDIAVNGRTAGNWRLNLYYGGPDMDTVADLIFGLDIVAPVGVPINTHDINANGNTELFSGDWPGEVLYMFELGADSDSIPDLALRPFPTPSYLYSFGEHAISGDFNGDDTADLVTNLRPRTEQDSLPGKLLIYWGGADFDTIPDLVIAEPAQYQRGSELFGKTLENIGDFSGDGYDDFFASAGGAFDDSLGYVFWGGPSIDSLPDLIITKRHTQVSAAGDINNDGYDDLIMSYDLPFGGGPVDIFYGGPEVDSIPDIRLFHHDLPGYNAYYGMDCVGLGDVNGDSIDDFAVSSVVNDGYSAVYVFAGFDDPITDVEAETDSRLPVGFDLHQNYPNPFNASTTISFGLDRTSMVDLSIFNVLGQRIETVVNSETLSAGIHNYVWPSDVTASISSGIYYYRLKVNGTATVKKMCLVR